MLYEMLTGKVPFTGPNPFAIMNDRLLNNPVPPREINPEISPELQEIIYRALERDPEEPLCQPASSPGISSIRTRSEWPSAPELTDWKQRRSPLGRRILFYVMLALIPVVIFGLLLWVARH